MIVSIDSGAQVYQQTLSMTYNGRTFDVLFQAFLDIAGRTLHVAFQSLDPQTNLPRDVLTGFLPAEDGSGRGKP